MRFRQFIFLEQDPMMGGDPMAGGAPPMGGGMGGDPMGGGAPPMGGMGGDPMGGGMGMGAPPPPAQGNNEAPAMPKTLDVWAVLDHILNNKPLPSKEAPKSQDDMMDGGDDMGGGDMMGGGPPVGDQGSALMV